MFIKKSTSKKKGFTLIEIMIVISILLVLIGFMIPKFSAYLDKAKTIKAMNTAKQVQTAAMASYGDNNGKFVDVDVTNNITTLTTLISADIGNSIVTGTDGQTLQVTFNSDGKPYTMDINASGNTYTLKQGTIVIFPKVP
jgi:type IV pilus assembly protein PilA